MSSLGKHFKQKELVKTIKTVLLATCAGPVLAGGGQDSAKLPGITVEGDNEDSYLIDKANSLKYSQPLLETPKTLIVLPKSVMDDRGVTNLQQALRGVPGISMASGEGGTPPGDNMSIRGFSAQTDMFVDGFRDLAGYSRDIYNIEALEVSKGPSSSVYGRGSVGGSINMVRKTARLDSFTNVSFKQGTESDHRLTLDTNHTIGNSAAFRINALSTDGGVPGRDKINKEMNALAVALATGLDTPVRWKASAEYQKQDNLPDYGLPWVPDYPSSSYPNYSLASEIAGRAGKTPRESLFDNFYGNKKRDYDDIKATNFALTFERDVTDSGMLQLRYKYSKVERESIVTAPRFSYKKIGDNRIYGPDVSMGSEKKRDAETELKSWQGTYIGTLDFGSLTHEFSLGVEYAVEEQQTWDRSDDPKYGGRKDNLASQSTSLTNPDSYSRAYTGKYVRTGKGREYESTTLAFYAFDTITISDKWEVTAGLRQERYKNDTYVGNKTPTYKLKHTENMTSWNTGLVYKIRPNGNIFIGAGKSFNPAGEDLSINYWDNQINLKPEESTGIELGTKWELFNNRALLSIALFRTKKDKVRTDDPSRSKSTVKDDDPSTTWDSYANINGGKQRVHGVEIGVFGQITKKLSLSGGYTYQKSKILKSTGDDKKDTEGNELARTPEHSFALWGNYDISRKLSTGLGVQYTSNQWSSSWSTWRKRVPNYTVVDAMAKYQFTDNISVRFNADNIFDERYVGVAGGSEFIPGRARYFSIALDYSL